MWHFATSMSTPAPSPQSPPPGSPTPRRAFVASTSVWIVLLIVVAVVLAGVGFAAGYEYRGSPASSPGAVENSTLSILGAGTLGPYFPSLASALVNETPGISAPTASQTYEGSLDITNAITGGTATADVAAVADYRLIPNLLEPKYAGWEIAWGATPEVLVYNPTISAFSGITSENWGTVLLAALHTKGVAPFGVWNASTDPNGYNEIFSMMLQGMLFDSGNISQIYSQLYSGAPGALAIPNPTLTLPEHESQAATLVETGVVSAVITYRAFAVANVGPDLNYVSFNPIVGLSANNSTALSDYAKLSTSIITSSGGIASVYPAPVLFAITVPLNAPNPALGVAFLHLLLSPQGQAIITKNGAFTPIFPGWSDRPSAVPSELAPDVVPLPGWAQTILG
jgi:molybdate/tungstate transport system substrate-binding protein